MNENIINVDYDLIFASSDFNELEENIVNQVVCEVNQFIKHVKADTKIRSIDLLSGTTNDENDVGMVLVLSKPGEITTKYEELESYLNNQEVKYSIISKTSSHAEVGAGGGGSELLLFLATSAASGVTWDLLKAGISNFVSPLEHTTYKMIESYRFKKIRSIVADGSKIHKKELILNDFQLDKDEGTIQMVFKGKRKYIYICCDKEYNILRYNLSTKKVILEMVKS